MVKKQTVVFDSGNELAAYAAKQINYHVMGYFPITPSTQVAEHLDALKADGEHNVALVPADGEHGAAGICYGASVGGGRVFNATSANGLLYALEQLPVQSGTRMPMVMNVACRTVSGPLSIKGDHSDIMYTLNTGWVILFAYTPQGVYDMNICALKIAEKLSLPVIVAYDGFFTSHQKRRAEVFAEDKDVLDFLGEYKPEHHALDPNKPLTFGSYMNEPDLINNKFQLHLAMEEARTVVPEVLNEYAALSGRSYNVVEGYNMEDAEAAIFVLGSSYDTAKQAVDELRKDGKKVGVFTSNVLRPWPKEDLYNMCKNVKAILVADRQDSYGAEGGNMTLELKATLQDYKANIDVVSRVYGLSGKDFYVEDAIAMFEQVLEIANSQKVESRFDYYGHYKGTEGYNPEQFFNPITKEESSPGLTSVELDPETGRYKVKGGLPKDATKMPKRWAPGHGACPGCGIPVNINHLLKGIEGNVVLLFHTGCGMVVTTAYPKSSFRVTYIHNLFQNGAATLSGVVEVFEEKQRRGEIPSGDDFTFVMVSGDGGLDIGMGPAIGAALRNHKMIIMEYDNGGYMNTGYQLSYTTPRGAKTSTSHVGPAQQGKLNFHKDTPMIMAATHIPYVATVSESQPADFIKKAAKAQKYAKEHGLAFIKALSACPLNWGDNPRYERNVIDAGVNSCYHPLFEIEQGVTTLTYNPEDRNKKISVEEFFKMMGRTKHLLKPENKEVLDAIQVEVDRRWERLKAMSENPVL
ncbi:pyruvate ferredoxin oxidoreductase alpha subunit [Natranaerovirga pectinivora]|uniref:Pyruvate ferredoxin oxidoreductase alpha subunit n=1 Tax=Natranaerovirga pectinivora TaxID=682400 RepID=A0A4R3MKE7_9FIRM|nr:thiamine pyrophosphate-dependent enzyme [Natranaerovirga pectinivora]TCT12282.1 pyruvate ferredoxin oxidoreductase alpha subunit [Natranaerovirga pectinivora]